MIGRHFIFAGLFAAASFANAGTVETSSAKVQPAWSFNAGVAGEAPAAQSMIAGPGSWSAHSRMGDVGSSSTMLFSQSGAASSAPALLSSSAVSAAAPPAAAFSETAPSAVTPSAAASPAAAPSVANMAVTAPAPAELAVIVASADADRTIIAAVDAVDVPEPATGMLMLAGLLGAGLLRRRKN